MRELTNEVKEQIREMVYNYLEEECETDRSQFDDNTNIIEDLDGDSLMFVELVELLRKQYDLSIHLLFGLRKRRRDCKRRIKENEQISKKRVGNL